MIAAPCEGRVLAVRGGKDMEVRTAEGKLRCGARGLLRGDVLPGDRVEVRTERPGEGTVLTVYPRRNRLIRPAVANVDRMILVVSAAPPVTDLGFIDGMLAVAAQNGAEPVLCLNKCDEAPGEELCGLYTRAGYRVLRVSARTGEGMEALPSLLSEGTVVFAGNSGVGKSSLLNRILPREAIRTDALSERIGRGKNTTRHATLYPCAWGALVCDTPGFSVFDPVEMGLTEPEKLVFCFPEFSACLGQCRYTDCGHTTEEDCAILAALRRGEIAQSRHGSYLALRAELTEYRRRNVARLAAARRGEGQHAADPQRS